MLEAQNGICLICEKPVVKPCLDHSHQKKNKGTGMIRGVLCLTCNSFVGKIENACVRNRIQNAELPRVLSNISEYLSKPHTNMMHYTEVPKEPKIKKSMYNKLKKAYTTDITNKKAFPEFPKSGKVTKELQKLSEKYDIILV